MIPRAPFGSMERFVGMLIEHFAGAFPLWLAPEQVRVLPLSDQHLDYAHHVESRFRSAGFRVSVDHHSARVNAKIRQAQLDLIPYMIVVGGKEEEAQAVSLRDRIDGDLGSFPINDAIEKLKNEVENRKIRQTFQADFAGLEADQDVANEY